MIKAVRRTIVPILFATIASAGHAQFYKSVNLKGGSLSGGWAGQLTTSLTSNPGTVNATVTNPAGGSINEVVSGQQQFTPTTGGLLVSLQLHPVPFAGVEVNYGYFKSSEIYSFNYSGVTTPQQLRFPVAANEATAAYEFHPPRIPFQPFVNIGGGAISFLPQNASNQWRGTGLVEAGLDIPTHAPHLAFRIEGRSLIYRAPNFNQAAISTRGWRVTNEPVFSVVYRF